MTEPLSPIAMDGLEEMFNIGAVTASGALARMVGSQVRVSRPEVRVDAAERIFAQLRDHDAVRTVVQIAVSGELRGRMFLLLDPDQAGRLARAVMERMVAHPDDGLSQSAVAEIANILTATTITAMSSFLGIRITQHAPSVVTDMTGAALDALFAELGGSGAGILSAGADLEVERSDVRVTLLYLFDDRATATMVTASLRHLNPGTHAS